MKRLCAVLVAGLCLGACAKTTIDTSVTEAPLVATTTTLPVGPAGQLLPRLVTEAGKLSNLIGGGGGGGGGGGDKGTQMNVIENLFAVARPEIAATDGVAALGFDGAMELCRRAVKFNRPADADKCFRNLSSLADSYLATNP